MLTFSLGDEKYTHNLQDDRIKFKVISFDFYIFIVIYYMKLKQLSLESFLLPIVRGIVPEE